MRRMFWAVLWLWASAATAGAELDTLWTRTYGALGADGARAAIPTDDGGFILVGYTYSYDPDDVNVYLVKTNSAGFPVWTGVYGGAGRDFGFDVCQAGDGGYVVAGHTSSTGAGKLDLYLLKVDAGGEEVWARTYGGSEEDEGCAVCPTSDGGFLVTGRTESFGVGESDVFLVKTDAAGDTIWTRTYGGVAGDVGTGCCETLDGNYAVSGLTGSFSANQDMLLMKIDAQGDSLWRVCEGDASNADWGWSLCPLTDGSLVVAGSGDLHGSVFQQAYIASYDEDGNRQWGNHYGLGTYYDYGWSICPTSDAGFVVAGATKDAATRENDIYVIRLDAGGQQVWAGSFGGAGSEWGSAVAEISPGNYIIAGHTESRGAGHFDMWLLRLYDPAVQSTPASGGIPPGQLRLDANPFRGRASIRYVLDHPASVRLEIVDPAGRRVATVVDGLRPAGEHHAVWNARRADSGIYYCLLSVDEVRSISRALLIR